MFRTLVHYLDAFIKIKLFQDIFPGFLILNICGICSHCTTVVPSGVASPEILEGPKCLILGE